MSEAAAYVPLMGFKPNEYTLHNAAPVPQTFRWAGLQFTLPPVDMVCEQSAIDFDGEKIPGSFVLVDTYSPDRDGLIPDRSSPPNWLAFEAIRNVLGVDPITKVARGTAALLGISFLPQRPTKDLVAKVREDGRRRWLQSQTEWANYTVAAYEARVAAARAAGVAAAPPDRDYAKAVEILKKAKGEVEPVVEEAGDEEMEFLAFAKARALEMAGKAADGKNVDRGQLAEELLQDPKVRAYLGRKFQIRKRGYLDVPGPPDQEG